MCVQVPGFILPILLGLIVPFFAGKRPPREKTENLTIWTLQKKSDKLTCDSQSSEEVYYVSDSLEMNSG